MADMEFSKLAPYIKSIIYLVLTNVELEAIKVIGAKKPSSVSGKAGEVPWVNFLIDHHFVMFHWNLLSQQKLEVWWESWTMQDFHKIASSKLRAMIKIILHYGEDLNAALLLFRWEDGQSVPSLDAALQPSAGDESKSLGHHVETNSTEVAQGMVFIIFALYRIPRQIIKKVLELHGIRYQEFDGTTTVKVQNLALKQFHEDAEALVLLMSNVRAVGLNITWACIVVVMDQLWSYLDLLQILDEMMLGYANGKSLMQDDLVQDKNLLHSIYGWDMDPQSEEEDQADELGAAGTKTSRGKKSTHVKPRPTEQKPVGVEQCGCSKSETPLACGTPEPSMPPGPLSVEEASQSTFVTSTDQLHTEPNISSSPSDPKGKGKANIQAPSSRPLGDHV
ncbi:hypothetical protein FRC06_003663 [Ceratobasidium sp. 370]|nr:hypothetical protein FRC06_003663 [Ceratobasidium sp. 370]